MIESFRVLDLTEGCKILCKWEENLYEATIIHRSNHTITPSFTITYNGYSSRHDEVYTYEEARHAFFPVTPEDLSMIRKRDRERVKGRSSGGKKRRIEQTESSPDDRKKRREMEAKKREERLEARKRKQANRMATIDQRDQGSSSSSTSTGANGSAAAAVERKIDSRKVKEPIRRVALQRMAGKPPGTPLPRIEASLTNDDDGEIRSKRRLEVPLPPVLQVSGDSLTKHELRQIKTPADVTIYTIFLKYLSTLSICEAHFEMLKKEYTCNISVTSIEPMDMIIFISEGYNKMMANDLAKIEGNDAIYLRDTYDGNYENWFGATSLLRFMSKLDNAWQASAWTNTHFKSMKGKITNFVAYLNKNRHNFLEKEVESNSGSGPSQ
ncbi:unnamed protein product [Caenorhabditis bovis]|uniref:MRG domain-containing protein n=1 Tax=Caenorhabditis bovis TaxID=2654633 RepID=A0A8S1EHH1_9PELO|nr:unnamed protein product [Caenorhabditis bovis]